MENRKTIIKVTENGRDMVHILPADFYITVVAKRNKTIVLFELTPNIASAVVKLVIHKDSPLNSVRYSELDKTCWEDIGERMTWLVGNDVFCLVRKVDDNGDYYIDLDCFKLKWKIALESLLNRFKNNILEMR